MEEYQKRVIQEQKELQEKIDKLEEFLNDSNKISIVNKKEYPILSDQFEKMLFYNQDLLERIALYK